MDKLDAVIRVFPKEFRNELKEHIAEFEKLQEIRIRIGAPILLYIDGKEHILKERIIAKENLDEMVEYISGYSIYAFLEEVKQGFITLQGGHRVGLAGKAVMEKDHIKNIHYISALNLRISHEIHGCSEEILPFLYDEGEPCHTLIISPPGCGKTTLLRDCIRQISNGTKHGRGVSVTVVDERSEIAACYQGIPQNQMGIRTDVLDCCKKTVGMELAIRALAPKVLALDELGGEEDVEAVEKMIHCGCCILSTIHGADLEDIRKKPHLKRMLNEKWFQRFVVLGKGRIGKIEGVYDGQGRRLH